MATGEQVALQPALQGVLTEHLHHPPLAGQFATVQILR